MKLEINIDPKIKETIIKIFAESMNDDVALVQSILGYSSVNRIVGFKNEEISLLEPDDIIRFFTNDKKVFAQTMKNEYLVRLRMYELEERFRSTTFIRISQGELKQLSAIGISTLDGAEVQSLEVKGNVYTLWKRYCTYSKRRKDIKGIKYIGRNIK